MKKRIVSFCLAFIIFIGLLSSCGRAESTNPTNTNAAASGGVVEITYLKAGLENPADNHAFTQEIIEKELGIKLTPMFLTFNTEQLNILIASDSLPDCFWIYDPDPIELYYKQEVVRTIPLDMMKKYAPTYLTYYDKYPILWVQSLLKGSDSELVTISGVTETYTDKLYLYNDFYRYDWLMNTGVDLEVNIEKIADSMYIADKAVAPSKFKEMLDAFVNGDPDGNGIKDTIGLVKMNINQCVLPGFGIGPTDVEVNGQLEMYYATEPYKNMLIYLADLYKNGLLDQEILTQNRSVAWEKMVNNKAGVCSESTNSLNPWAMDRPPLSVLAVNPDYEFLMVPGLRDENGGFGNAGFQSPNYGWFYVNRKVTDDYKLQKILEFVEFACFARGDQELSATMYYGEKGVYWEFDDKGVPQMLKEDYPSGYGSGVFGSEYAEVGFIWDWITLLPLFNAGAKYYVGENGIWNKYIKTPERFDPLGETNIIEVKTAVQTNINDVVSTFRSNVILGTVDVEAQWDQYTKDLNNAGYDKLMAEMRKMKPYEELIK